jgi:hypothetical protein
MRKFFTSAAMGTATLLAVAAAAPAARATDAIDYMTQATARVASAAQVAGDVANYGYIGEDCFLGAYLDQGSDVNFERSDMAAGQDYMLVAAGDDDATRVDIAVLQEGVVVARSEQVEGRALLRFCPSGAGKYTIRVRLAGCSSSGSFVSLMTLKKDGFTVPVSHLTSAAGHLLALCRRVDQRVRENGCQTRFQDAHNQWCVFGSILKTGQSGGVAHLNPDAGDQIFLVAGDDDTRSVELRLADNDGSVLDHSRADEPCAALVHQAVANGNYQLTARMAASADDSYSLVLSTDLRVR